MRRARAPQRLLAAPPAASCAARARRASFALDEEAHAFLVDALGRPLAETPPADERALRQAERAIAETVEHHAHLRWRRGGGPDRIARMPTTVRRKWVYDFAEGSRDMRDLLGGKGANVAEMTRVLGAERVPGGFTITTEACVAYMRDDRAFPDGLDEQVAEALARARGARRQAARRRRRTRCSSRCARGARESMPGMLDTVLNLGLNDDSVPGLAAQTGNERFAWDSYRRFVQMFGNVVRGHRGRALRGRDQARQARPRRQATTPSSTSTRCASSSRTFQALLRVPDRPARAARAGASGAVFDSWMGERAVDLPAHQPHPRRLGHGGQRAADGLRQQGRRRRAPASPSAATRSPARPSPSGDFLPNAQGEDVVSGVRNTARHLPSSTDVAARGPRRS